mgnify:CR=1 FL=1
MRLDHAVEHSVCRVAGEDGDSCIVHAQQQSDHLAHAAAGQRRQLIGHRGRSDGVGDAGHSHRGRSAGRGRDRRHAPAARLL